LIARLVSRFVTGSLSAAIQLKKVLRLNQEKCHALHNGIALREVTETGEETRKRLGLDKFDGVLFGVVAILRPNKGHQVLLDAIAKLAAAGAQHLAPPIKILIEGDGPLRDELQEFVANNHLSEQCIFVGEEENVMNFMALLDVLILPSVDHEDFPNVILEAMGLGKPVIASRLAGTPEQLVDRETGILVTPREADQLAAAINRLSLDERLRLSMGQAGRRRFQTLFTAEVAVENYLSLYRSLIGSQIK
jgi:glycosyltransferase involved in cell wall biosynthesis